jgi:hypothetical protein
MADTTTSFEGVRKLQGAQNYKEWKTTAVGCLLEKNCYDVVDGSYPQPDKQFMEDGTSILETAESKKELREWNKMNNMAKGILIRIVSSPIGAEIPARTAEEAWIYLEETYDTMGLNKTISTYQVLHQFKLKNSGDPSTQCQKFKRLLQDAEDAGHTFNDKTKVSLFIHLTEEAGFANFAYLHKTAIRKDDEFPKLDALITEFIDDCASTRRNGNGASLFYNNHNNRPNGNRDNKKKKCDHCKKPGHAAADCWKLHPEKQPKRDDKDKDKKDGDKPSNEPSGYRSLNLMATHKGKAYSLNHRHLLDQQNAWIYDTGANSHVCKDRELFTLLEPYDSVIDVGEGETVVHGIGTVKVSFQGIEGPLDVTLSDVLFAPNCIANIISEDAAKTKSGVYYHGKLEAMCHDDDTPLAECPKFYGLPHLMVATQHQNVALLTGSPEMWHKRLGHLPMAKLTSMSNLLTGMQLTGDVRTTPIHNCEPCLRGKAKQKISRKPQHRSSQPFEKIHLDTVSVTQKGFNGEKLGLIITEDASRARWSFQSATKTFFQLLEEFLHLIYNQTGLTVKTIRTDNGTEFGGSKLSDFCTLNGIYLETSAPHTQHQNGVSEAAIHVVNDIARCLMLEAGLPPEFWPYAQQTAVHLANRRPSKTSQGVSPTQLLTRLLGNEEKPTVDHLRVWGCVAYVWTPPQRRAAGDKYGARSERGFLVGYDGNSIWEVWVPSEDRVVRSSSVTFVEDVKYATSDEQRSALNSQFAHLPITNAYSYDDSDDDEDDPQTHYPTPRSQTPHGFQPGGEDDTFEQPDGMSTRLIEQRYEDEFARSESIDESREDEDFQDFEGDSLEVGGNTELDASVHYPSLPQPGSPSPLGDYPELNLVHRRGDPQKFSKVFCFAMYKAIDSSDRFSDSEPRNYKEAMRSVDAKEWKAAFDLEVNTCIKTKTWILKKLPLGAIVLPGIWVCKVKRDEDGKITRYKARWCVRGDLQKIDLAYDKTFAAVVKTSSWRLILVFIAIEDMECLQADAVNAFLNASMALRASGKKVYVQQPQGYHQGDKDIVCELLNALYGMKESPLLWYLTLLKILEMLGFKPLIWDKCVFTRGTGKDLVIIMVYVDDFAVAARTRVLAQSVLTDLSKHFQLKELGDIHYFLGCRIVRDREKRAVYITQDAYVEKTVKAYGFEGAATPATPLPSEKMSKFTGTANKGDIKKYQALVGSLMWPATQTRPDICYSVGLLCRFLANPSDKHIKAAEHCLRYLSGTRNYALSYVANPQGLTKAEFRGPSADDDLTGYTDASFGDCADTRRSTSGFVFTVCGGPVSFKAGRQPHVTTSTAEAEYAALSYASREAVYLRRIAAELGFNIQRPTIIHEDNSPAIDMTKKETNNSDRTKHINIAFHYTREQIKDKHIEVKWIATTDQKADGLTKPLTAEGHLKFCRQLNLVNVRNAGQPGKTTIEDI